MSGPLDNVFSAPPGLPAEPGTPDSSLLELFRDEVRTHASTVQTGLDRVISSPTDLEPLIRAAHSVRGAARIVGIDPVVKLAGTAEDTLLAAQHLPTPLSAGAISALRQACELLLSIADEELGELARGLPRHASAFAECLERLTANLALEPAPAVPVQSAAPPPPLAINRAQDPTGTERPGNGTPIRPGRSSDPSLAELFREEVRSQVQVLTDGLMALEEDLANAQLIEPLMRAAHSIKGAGRIVNFEAAVQLAHVLEDAFVAAQRGQITLRSQEVDLFLKGIDALASLGQCPPDEYESQLPARHPEMAQLIQRLHGVASGKGAVPGGETAASTESGGSREESVLSTNAATATSVPAAPMPAEPAQSSRSEIEPAKGRDATAVTDERVVRVTAHSLSRLMSLAGESLVEARWLQPFSQSLLILKQNQDHLAALVEEMQHAIASDSDGASVTRLAQEARQQIVACRQLLADRIGEFETHARQSDDLNSRLYHEVIASRMRPFADGVQGFPRMVRDLARQLGKKVKFEVVGQQTDVDRDILEKLEAPLNHILRNAVDHGLETPEQRENVGKPETGLLRLEARHRAGMLSILVTDDGHGISPERLRRTIVERGLSTSELAANMGESELFDFLFLPGFSTAEKVTEVSGRGVGLDVVHSMITSVGGTVRVTSKPGSGTTFHLLLPITLSVLRAVLVTIADEPYAFPHNRIDRLLRLRREEIRSLEGRHYFSVDGRNIGLLMAHQILNLPAQESQSPHLCVVLISDHHSEYGVIVDSFCGEQDLVVRPLDSRLGKVPNISAAALLEDGSPVLIVDVDDFLRTTDGILKEGRLRRTKNAAATLAEKAKKRILVVEDSITVREAERQLLVNRGYEVDVAVDGMDGWNAVRETHFDLVVSDIDMPRMNGLEFVKNVKSDPQLNSTPVVIVSYKGREEDRLRGLEAGADYYLTKASFHDDTLLDAVFDLIGEP